MADTISTRIDPFELFKLTGVQPSHVPSLCKILWEQKQLPEVHRNTHRWMFLCNYIAYRMTGECLTDPSQACRSMVYDIRKGEWSKQICALFDIDPMIFPPVKDTGSVIGPLLKAVARRTGLRPDLEVVLGGHDHLCGSLATGLSTIGTAINSSGTVDNATTLIDPAAIGRGLFDMGVSSGKFLLPDTTYAMGSVQGAGRTIEWFMQRFYPEFGDDTEKGYEKMMSEADQAPPGSDGIVFMPHLRGSIVPHKSPTARGAFLGLKDTHTRGALARAVFEGLAMEFRLMIEGIESAVRNDIHDIRCFGGGSRNATWIRIKADVLDRVLTVYQSRENTCLGAALLAGIGNGCYRHLGDAIDRVRHRTVTVKPCEDAARRYESWFGEVYRSVFEAVDTVNRKISDHSLRAEIF
jgi:xylulokinase